MSNSHGWTPVGLLALLLLPVCACASSGGTVQDPNLVEDEAADSAEDPGPRRGRISVLLGGRSLGDDDYWDPVEDHGMLGLEIANAISGPFDWEAGLLFSTGEDDVGDADVSATLAEIYGGATWSPVRDRLRPYIGGGLSLLSVRTESTDEVQGGNVTTWDDDGTLAWYARAGVMWQATPVFGIGLDYRLLRDSDIRLFRTDADADYDQVALVISLGF